MVAGTNGPLSIHIHNVDLELLWTIWFSENTGEIDGYICIAFSMTWVSVLQSASAPSMGGGLSTRVWELSSELNFVHSAVAGESHVQATAQVFGAFFPPNMMN